jgi:hypothetical protein
LVSHLGVLEQVAELLRPHYRPTPPSNGEDLAGSTIKDVAAKILGESPGCFFRASDVANEAMRRGYRSTSSRNPDNNPHTNAESFYMTMMRHSDVFEKVGQLFKLRQTAVASDRDMMLCHD